MPTFLMMTQVSTEAARSPQALESLEQEVMERIRQECPQVEWIQSFAVLGPYDYVDIFRAPDVETATKVATLIRTYGHSHSEVWAATDWGRFKELIHGMPEVA